MQVSFGHCVTRRRKYTQPNSILALVSVGLTWPPETRNCGAGYPTESSERDTKCIIGWMTKHEVENFLTNDSSTDQYDRCWHSVFLFRNDYDLADTSLRLN